MLDFGLAKLTQDEQKVTHKTRAGSVMGTPYYMSPEQCEGKIEIDHRADIYSLGVMLFEMLTGKVPFGGEGYGEIIVKHVTMPPPSTRSVVPELPDYLDLILFRALAKDRDQRFQTMAELREALLDPERYLSSAPEIGIPDDLSGHRAGGRADVAVRDGHARLPAGWHRLGAGPGAVVRRHPLDVPRGARRADREPHPQAAEQPGDPVRRHRGAGRRGGGAVRRRAASRGTRSPGDAAPAPELGPRELQLRSGRRGDHARDGKTLGLTPLSIEVPYSDSAVEFMFKKSGYESKTMYVVPNLPSPLFATLRRIEIEPEAAARRPTRPPPPSGAVRRVRDKTANAPQQPQQPQRPEKVDEDGVLEPSFR